MHIWLEQNMVIKKQILLFLEINTQSVFHKKFSHLNTGCKVIDGTKTSLVQIQL